MQKLRPWIFRLFILLTAFLMLVSAYLPWWGAKVELVVTPASGLTEFKVMLYQHGIPTTAGAEYFQTDVTPASQVKLAWAYIGVSMALLLTGSFLKGKKSKWLIGVVSFAYIAYALGAFYLISQRTAVYKVPIAGQTILQAQNGEIVVTGFQIGYWIAFASGLVGIGLALLRDKITGQKNLKI